MNVKRITLTGTTTKIEFDDKCGKWLVKNFTDNDIFAAFEVGENNELDESTSAKIKSNYGQVVINNERLQFNTIYETNAIYIKGTGEVEVQQLCFH
jgi:hypothetical protein